MTGHFTATGKQSGGDLTAGADQVRASLSAGDEQVCTGGFGTESENVRRRYAASASKRFELRVTEATLAAWRELAAAHGVTVAEMVRLAMFTAAHGVTAVEATQLISSAQNRGEVAK